MTIGMTIEMTIGETIRYNGGNNENKAKQENNGILSCAVEAERTPEAVAVSGHTVTRARLGHIPAWLVLFGAR